jgi:hypothetical protein
MSAGLTVILFFLSLSRKILNRLYILLHSQLTRCHKPIPINLNKAFKNTIISQIENYSVNVPPPAKAIKSSQMLIIVDTERTDVSETVSVSIIRKWSNASIWNKLQTCKKLCFLLLHELIERFYAEYKSAISDTVFIFKNKSMASIQSKNSKSEDRDCFHHQDLISHFDTSNIHLLHTNTSVASSSSVNRHQQLKTSSVQSLSYREFTLAAVHSLQESCAYQLLP